MSLPPPRPSLQEGKHPVIKLALKGTEKKGPFVRIPALPNTDGGLLRLLKSRAIAMSTGGEANEVGGSVMTAFYDVQLTYKDLEGDLCWMMTDQDVLDALSEAKAADSCSIKMFAAVQARKEHEPRQHAATQTARAATRSTGTSTTTTAAPPRGGGAPPQLHQAVESIVGILGGAVVEIQRLLQPENNNNNSTARPTAAAAGNAPRSNTPSRAPTVASVAPPPPAAAVSTASTASTSSSKETGQEPSGAAAPTDPPAITATAEHAAAATTTAPSPRPFIHGRHTCDGCLSTPIIGKRFHATNLPDYDLCGKCKDNYKGKEITFESVELDRDRPFQDRWHRRFAKWGTHGRPHFRKHGPGRFGGGGCRGGGPRGALFVHQSPPCAGFSHVAAAALAPPPSAAAEVADLGLREAIRRSLADAPPSENGAAPTVTTTESPKESVTLASATEPPTDAPSEALVESTKPAPKNEPEEEEEEVKAPAAVTTIPVVETVVPPFPSAPTEEEIVVPPVAAAAQEFSIPALEEPDSYDDMPALETTTTTPTKIDPSAFAKDAAGNGSVAAEIGITMDKIVKAIKEFNDELDRTPNSSPPRNSSSDDDDDDDDEEEAMKSSRVDDDDDDDSSVPSLLSQGRNAESDDEDLPPLIDIEDQKPAAVEDQGVTTIVNGEEEEEEAKDDDTGSHNSWQVVDEENQQIQEDEALARATQMIGSALFNSDMKSSAEVSAMSSSSQACSSASSSGSSSSSSTSSNASSSFEPTVSEVDTVLTTLPSIASEQGQAASVQLSRWSAQLNQLHELGFDNDDLLVDVIERINAANIGSDESGEVTVQRVVDELMKD